MLNQKSEIRNQRLPFQISNLPEGVSIDSNRIQIAPHAKGTVVLRMEGHITDSELDLNIAAGRDSHLKIVLFQNIADTDELEMRIVCKLEESARVDFIQFHLGGAKVHVNLIQEAVGPQAELNADLLSRTKNSQKHHFDLTNIYSVKNGRGKILAKGIALDESSLTMNGTIRISRKGGGTDAYLKQDSLLLSKKAGIKATPGLKIDTNDVKAGHGASVTNLNDESLFYLTSRGIGKEAAKKMMISGFMAEQLEKIDDLPELKEEILQTI